MTHDEASHITTLLGEASQGSREAAETLLPLLYEALRELARAQMSRLPPGHTLQPTALVHEAWMRLAGQDDPGWNGRGHFFGAAARAMRLILVDHARSRGALKRGGDRHRVELEPERTPDPNVGGALEDVLAVDDALTRMEAVHPRRAAVVVHRYFGGLSVAETAEALDIAPRSVERDWTFARAWLQRELADGHG